MLHFTLSPVSYFLCLLFFSLQDSSCDICHSLLPKAVVCVCLNFRHPSWVGIGTDLLLPIVNKAVMNMSI